MRVLNQHYSHWPRFCRAALVASCLTLAMLGGVAPANVAAQSALDSIEPNAGAWRTWVLEAPDQFPVPPPPDAAATQVELQGLEQLQAARGATEQERVRFWDSGSPGYRWNQLLIGLASKNIPRGRT